MRKVWPILRGTLPRVFPDTLTFAQAVAFNMFLAFFPMLLMVLGVIAGAGRLSSVGEELLSGLGALLPPGSRRVLTDYLTQPGDQPATWILLGLGGTLVGGLGVMSGLMDGFRQVYRTRTPPPAFWKLQVRALALLLVTGGPWLAAVVLTVFGKQVREWMIARLGLPELFNTLWVIVYSGLALVVAAIILSLIYRVGRPGCRTWNEAVPGAVLATLLWWAVSTVFGIYVRQVPYTRMYGGLAAAIGMLIWMYLSAVVVFLGAAFNAELWGRPVRAAAQATPQASGQAADRREQA